MDPLARAHDVYQEGGAIALARRTMRSLRTRTARNVETALLHRRLKFVTRSELKQCAADRGRFWGGEPESPCRISSPASSGLLREFERFAGEYRPEPRFLCELQGCQLVGPSAMGLLDGDGIVLETVGSDRGYFYDNVDDHLAGNKAAMLLRRLSPLSPSVPTYDRSYVFPLVPFYHNYYYPWLVEYLPKLRALARYEAETGRRPVVLIDSDAPSFVTETLSLLGYGDRYERWDGSAYEIDNLLITNHRLNTAWAGRHYGFHPSPDDFAWVREGIRSGVGGHGTGVESGKKLYVSRQETDRGRRVRNYDEIEGVLRERGFEPYVFESFSVSEQVRMISNADVVLAPHGAGLANMLFADDPLIVELFPATHLQPSYYLLSQALGFDYESIVVEASENEPDDDLLVDPTELRRRLDALAL